MFEVCVGGGVVVEGCVCVCVCARGVGWVCGIQILSKKTGKFFLKGKKKLILILIWGKPLKRSILIVNFNQSSFLTNFVKNFPIG